MIAVNRPTTKTSSGQLPSDPAMPSSTGVAMLAGIRTKPASTRPMNAMNRPMPTLIAVFSSTGTARNTAVRNPVSTRTRMIRPSSTTMPMASCQDMSGQRGDRVRDDRVQAEARGERQREVGDDAHEDGEHARDERGRRRDGRQVRDVAAAEEQSVAGADRADDQGVEHDDVAHREEGDETTTDLGTDGRAALGDLEVAVDSVRRRRRTFRLRSGGRRHARSVADLCFVCLTKRSRSFRAAD